MIHRIARKDSFKHTNIVTQWETNGTDKEPDFTHKHLKLHKIIRLKHKLIPTKAKTKPHPAGLNTETNRSFAHGRLLGKQMSLTACSNFKAFHFILVSMQTVLSGNHK